MDDQIPLSASESPPAASESPPATPNNSELDSTNTAQNQPQTDQKKKKSPRKENEAVTKWIRRKLEEKSMSKKELITAANGSKANAFKGLNKESSSGYTQRINCSLESLKNNGKITENNSKFSIVKKTKKDKGKKRPHKEEEEEDEEEKNENDFGNNNNNNNSSMKKSKPLDSNQKLKGGDWSSYVLALDDNSKKQPYIEAIHETKVRCFALIVANSAYQANKLPGAFQDGIKMVRALLDLGFCIKLLLNSTKSDFDKELKSLFGASPSGKGAVNVFFYAGHGFTSDEKKTVFECPEGSDVIFEPLLEKAASFICVLDSCRSSTRASNKVWHAPIANQKGILIEFATSEGYTAGEDKNGGDFTRVLLKHLDSDCSITDMFQRVRTELHRERQKNGNDPQIPVESTTLIGEPINLSKLKTH